LRAWQGRKYPAQWPAILDADTHERLAKMFADPARRKHAVRAQVRPTTTDSGHIAADSSARPGPITLPLISSQERIKRRPVLGGLINEYERAA